MLDFETRFDKNYDTIRYEYEQDLIENGYNHNIVDEVNDGRDEFLIKEYEIYKNS